MTPACIGSVASKASCERSFPEAEDPEVAFTDAEAEEGKGGPISSTSSGFIMLFRLNNPLRPDLSFLGSKNGNFKLSKAAD